MSHRSATAEAQYLRITDTLGYTIVDIQSPWQPGNRMGRYYLVEDKTTETPADGIRIQVPVQRLATTSATQMGFLHALDEQDCIVAMATPHLIYNAPAREIVDLGEDFNLNTEALLLSAPDLLLMTNYGAPMTNVDRIRQAGIVVMELVEWTEQDPLARAAWIRLFGALTCQRAAADSILQEVSTAYHDLTAQHPADAAKTLATGQSFRGTWYVPTAGTYMGHLVLDAGADYAFATDTTNSSLPLTLEQALTTFAEADVWVGVNAGSLAELAAIDEKHTWMKAYQTGQVYNFMRRINATGGNDYWETGIVHPEYILQDLMWTLHRDAMPDYEPRFVLQLQ